jgi:hypothetical protein
MTLARPMFPDRRGFLSLVGASAAAAVIPQPALADSRKPLDAAKASPALRAAVRALDDSNDRLTAAKARFEADDLKMVEWRELNPKPTNGRALKRWWRKWRDHHDATVCDSWDAQLEAERDFRTCQMAVAKVEPRDEDDLMLKAAAAAIYDKVKFASYGSSALISYSVVWDLLKQRMPAA